ncbi:early gene translational repressor [Escherichia phage Lw1]|uniref:Translation repressor protein n=2 Tax=Pseudotevenvirus TaxID=2842979 RepID=D9ICA0_BPRB1|nr:translation repressor [Escherichia phage RB16]YP_008060565.1 translation repressor [Escherichia phage Lw1]ADJ55343.1 RegA early gene translational repressor [Escherichia phage RB16]AGJ71450.1 early gene translational repressor [Escherichia phage Lw1]
MNMLEIKLSSDDSFLKIRETLTRIGIANNKKKMLWQSCHILQKQGRYFIVHFKELLRLDGRQVDMTEDDELRRNNIARLLEEWGMIEILTPDLKFSEENNFRVLTHAQKAEWTLKYKYRIGH